MHRHLQSHWIAVRRAMFTSAEFREYWDTMPMITTYVESILGHETRFTHHFERTRLRGRGRVFRGRTTRRGIPPCSTPTC